jgi:hypothetical protein
MPFHQNHTFCGLPGPLFENSCRRAGFNAAHSITYHRRRAQRKDVFASRDHRQSDVFSAVTMMNHLEVQPFTKPRIVNFRLTMPELRRKSALYLQMIKLQFNHTNLLWKVSAHVSNTDMKSRDLAALQLSLDYHCSPRISLQKSAHRARFTDTLPASIFFGKPLLTARSGTICCLCWTQFGQRSRSMRIWRNKYFQESI